MRHEGHQLPLDSPEVIVISTEQRRPEPRNLDLSPRQSMTPLRLLILEDNVHDCEREAAALESAGVACKWQRVETRDEFLLCLQTASYDVICANYRLPSLDGLTALGLLRHQSADIPFILIAGTPGEEAAIESLKAGATDYVLKDRLARLGPVVRRALAEAQKRRQLQVVEQALRESEARYRELFENANDIIYIHDLAGNLTSVNRAAEMVVGYKRDEARAMNIAQVIVPEHLEPARAAISRHLAGEAVPPHGLELRAKDGRRIAVEVNTRLMYTHGTACAVQGIARDITDRKRSEAAQQTEARISAALARVGHELISSLEEPQLLDRLCRLTTEVLGCDFAHLLLHEHEDVYVPVASCGEPAEYLEALRSVHPPREVIVGSLEHLEGNTGGSVRAADILDPMWSLFLKQSGITVILPSLLRRGRDIAGVITAGYRGREEPFTPEQERIAEGLGQLAAMALTNARLLAELERANRLKPEFVATMSHELRTPLNVIIGYNDLLCEGAFGPLSAEQSEILRRVGNSARQLHELINSTLDLSRLETGRALLDVAEVHVPDLLRELREETRNLQAKPGLKLSWQVAPELPPLRTDALKLKVILKNLIDNAVKFTERGNVTIDAHWRDGGVEIAVMDTGIGIAPEDLPIIFEPFRQVDGSTTRRYGGVGLGLNIVRHFLDLLGGRITVASTIGQGSHFRVWIPVLCGSLRSAPVDTVEYAEAHVSPYDAATGTTGQ